MSGSLVSGHVILKGTNDGLTDTIVWQRCAVVSCAKRDASAVLNAASVRRIAARWIIGRRGRIGQVTSHLS
jgi:hypothetical protein